MSPPPSVDYFSGMFANEPRGETSMWDFIHEQASACYHEASHAVVDYMFGHTLVSIGIKATVLREDDGELSVGYGGLVLTKGPETKPINFNYRPMHFRLGCVLAAGPAGERRYRHEVELPMRLLGPSEGDHQSIDKIAKALERRGRCRYAYQRHVWSHAQKIIADPMVWEAISGAADELYYDGCCELEMEDPGEFWAYIEPKRVYAHCRRAGLRRGMLNAA